MTESNLVGNGGVLSDRDILNEIHNGNIFIEPFDPLQLQPSGYNLTPTTFVYSTKKKRLLPIIKNAEETYVMVDRNDTVLVRTRESVAISSMITGAFYSKVKLVAEGFGHVSTTMDPNWEGQLLIALNNPNNIKIKLSIEKEVYGKRIRNSFVTLEFMYLNLFTNSNSDNPPGRMDILDNTMEHNVSFFKKKQIKVLSELVAQLHENENKTIENIILSNLTEGETEEWRQIKLLEDNDTYIEEKREFLAIKKRKYLRLINEQFQENALKSIQIVNEYIDKKQKIIPLKQKLLSFVYQNAFEIIGFILAVFLSVFIYEQYKANAMSIELLTLLLTIVVELLVPLIKPISVYIKENWFSI